MSRFCGRHNLVEHFCMECLEEFKQELRERLVEAVANKPEPLGYGTYEINAYRRAMKDLIETIEQVMDS